MKIFWFSWKDINHPLAGGAEVISDHLRRRLAAEGHTVTLITAVYPGAKTHESIDGVEVYRVGGRFSVYTKAHRLYRSLKPSPDLTIDEMNTIPFGAVFYSGCRSVLLTYQLARKVWFYQMSQPFSLIGYLAEPAYLYVLSRKYKEVLTESESTRQDLARYGFKEPNIKVFRVGLSTTPLIRLPAKTKGSVVLSLGAIRPMKRTMDAVKAFEAAKKLDSNLKLVIAGDDTEQYAKKVAKYARGSEHSADIEILGRVSAARRKELMMDAAVILVTSVKEGWGLIVSEANSLGTPAIAYDVDGLRDSIDDKRTGLLVKAGDTQAMGRAVADLLNDPSQYQQLRQEAWIQSKQYTFDNSYRDFASALKLKS